MLLSDRGQGLNIPYPFFPGHSLDQSIEPPGLLYNCSCCGGSIFLLKNLYKLETREC